LVSNIDLPALVRQGSGDGGTGNTCAHHQTVARSAHGLSSRRGNVTLRGVCTVAKKVVFHLAGKVLASPQIGQIQAVFIDLHGLVFQPSSPSVLADVFPNAFAKVARVGGEVQAFGLFFKLDAVDGTCHVVPLRGFSKRADFSKLCQGLL
jgi:hypothetical protein